MIKSKLKEWLKTIIKHKLITQQLSFLHILIRENCWGMPDIISDCCWSPSPWGSIISLMKNNAWLKVHSCSGNTRKMGWENILNVRGVTVLMSNHRGVMLTETWRLNATGDTGLLLWALWLAYCSWSAFCPSLHADLYIVPLFHSVSLQAVAVVIVGRIWGL